MRRGIIGAIALAVAGALIGGIGITVLVLKGMEPGQGAATGIINAAAAPGLIEFAPVVRQVFPAVVNISTVKVISPGGDVSQDPMLDLFGEFGDPLDEDPSGGWTEQGLGSGVIISSDGYVITNYHVVADAERIKVTLYDKRVFYGEIIGADPKTDIAVIKLPETGLPTLQWADSEALSVGEFVLAIGNPFGLSHTVTMGIVSAVGRADIGIADYEDFIQTDAAINPGNSGGPLVNTQGRLVGINTAIFSRSGGYQGIGFAVPSNMVQGVMDQLLREGRVVRGWIGVSIQDVSPELSEALGLKHFEGALVGESFKDGPAAMAGIERGDVIVQYDGIKVENPSGLRNLVAQSRPLATVSVGLFRRGVKQHVQLTVQEPPNSAEPETRPREKSREVEAAEEGDLFAGLSVMELTHQARAQLALQEDVRGVVVIGVAQGTPSDAAGLRRGDVISEIEWRAVKGLRDYETIGATVHDGQSAILYVNRAGRYFFAVLRGVQRVNP